MIKLDGPLKLNTYMLVHFVTYELSDDLKLGREIFGPDSYESFE